MKAAAQLTVDLGPQGRSVVRHLRSQAPMTLVPRRTAAASRDGAAVVHLVSSAATPLGGDEVELRVRVGPGARLRLRGTAATLALPGQHPAASRATVRIEVADDGLVEYLPEPTVVIARAQHHAELDVRLGTRARVRCRDTLILGRHGEPSGALTTTTRVVREDVPLLQQQLAVGSSQWESGPAYLAGSRVLATETVVWEHDPPAATSGPWWSLVPLPSGGALASTLATDAVAAGHRLAAALAHHPDANVFDTAW
ncbi:urease accessory protein UreD [Haloactinomyces albus]